MELDTILTALGVTGEYSAGQFCSDEDGEPYSVWKITTEDRCCVLKQAKEYEQEVYSTFLSGNPGYAPALLGSAEADGNRWLLLEYIEGEDLRFCTREKLTRVLDALIAMQKQWWEASGWEDAAFSMDKARPGRIRRGEDLGNEQLRRAYGEYLSLWEILPKTLCHEDALPFNVLVGPERAVFIDWEYGGMQPYVSSLARLIAHGEEHPDAFFHMTNADRDFAIDYYYTHLPREKGIGYGQYRRALDAFLLYEYCEWIMLGVRYGNTDSPRYSRYLALALEHINQKKDWEETENGNEQ